MRTVGLVTEGITDQAVLENMLCGLLGENEIDLNPLRPLRDQTDKTRVAENEFSNWELVFEYCASDTFKQALEFLDLGVIHVDVDQGEHPNFGVPLTEGGALREIPELVNDTRAVIVRKISAQIYQQYQHKIFFAVPILSIDCWLLPLYATGKIQSAYLNCDSRLVQVLLKRGWKKKISKDYNIYDGLSAPYRKAAVLTKARKVRRSIDMFLDD